MCEKRGRTANAVGANRSIRVGGSNVVRKQVGCGFQATVREVHISAGAGRQGDGERTHRSVARAEVIRVLIAAVLRRLPLRLIAVRMVVRVGGLAGRGIVSQRGNLDRRPDAGTEHQRQIAGNG